MTRHDLPKRWRTIPGRPGIYYSVPKHARHLWDNKQTVKLGDTEREAWRTWFQKTGGLDEIEKLTVTLLLDRFIHEHVSQYMAPGTYDSYKHHCIPLKRVFGNQRPAEIKPSMVYRYMDARVKNSGVKPSTANREASCLSSALNFAVRKGWIETNPLKRAIQKVGPYKETPRERVPTRDELETFCEFCPEWMKGYVALKMITGLRQGQMLAINLTEHWDGETLRPPTSKGGKDTAYKGPGLASTIGVILGDRLRVGPLFLNRNRSAVTATGFKSAWRRTMAKFVSAGNVRFNEHDIRKYTATEAETLEHAQRLLGHQSPKVTARVYRHGVEDVEVLK